MGKTELAILNLGVWLVLAYALSGLVGCSSVPTAMSTPGDGSFALKGSVIGEQSARKEIVAAHHFIQSGNYSQAISRLSQVTGSWPESEEAMEANFMLGQTYYELGGYGEASEHFERCLAMGPESPFASSCKDYLKRLTDPQGNPYEQPEFAEKRISELKALVLSHPDELAYQLDLGDQYWKNGNYDGACEIYNRIFLHWPKLLNDMVLRERIDWRGDGQYDVLSPDEVLRRYSEEDPLLLSGTTAFRSGRFTGYTQSFRETQYNVTGKVLNRSKSPLHKVKLHITIYALGGAVFETQTVEVGNLAPGATRPFNAVFSNFDDINNVARYEIEGDFERRQK